MTYDEEIEREIFEQNVFAQFYISTIVKNTDPRGFRLVSTTDKTKVEFCARGEDGYYVEDTLNAAWWAWRKRAKIASKGETLK